MQAVACQWAIGNDTHCLRTIADLPRFPDRQVRRKRLLIEPLEVAPAPNALFKNGMKNQRVKHGTVKSVSGAFRKIRLRISYRADRTRKLPHCEATEGCFS